MNLYLDDLDDLDDGFRKEAAYGSRLSETPENWPQELTSELYKQLPFLSDYEMNVNLDRVDPQRGFAFGYADVSNKTERPETEHGDMGIPHLRIPLIVKEKSAKPFSVYLDGEHVMPLNEERIREALFNPGTFDISGQAPRDPSLVEPLMPPTRSGAGYGGEYKMASADPAYLAGQGFAQSLVKTAGKDEHKEHSKVWGWRGYKPEHAAAVGGAMGAGTGAIYGDLYHKLLGKHGKRGLNKGRGKWRAGGAAIGAGLTAASAYHASKSKRSVPFETAAKKKHASVLHAIAPTLRENDVEAFIEKLAENPSIKAGLIRAGVAHDLIEVLDNTKRASADERLAYVAESIEPSVVTLHKLPGGDFLVKSANVDALNPQDMQGQVVPGQEAAQAIGPQNAQAMVPGQTATVTANPVPPPQEEQPDRRKLVDEFGEYKVIDAMGNTLFGWVFPETLAWDGSFTPQPIALFSNGSSFATQDSVVGELVGKGTNLPSDRPLGDGVFYTVKGGDAVATGPITVKSMMAGPDGLPKLVCHDLFGNQIQVSMTEGLANPQRITDVEYAIPTSWKFMRLNNQTQLQGGGQDMTADAAPEGVPGGQSDAPAAAPAQPGAGAAPKKPAPKKDAKPAQKKDKPTVQVNVGEKAKKEKTSAVLWYNGGFNIQGGCGLDKLAADYRYDMSPVDAEFMLGLLGVDGLTAKLKVAEARRTGSVKLAGLKTITLLSERFQEATKTASALASQVPDLRLDLTKEAAALDDKDTVNNLLALNFVNPENLETFIGYIPELEETTEKLAEMLLFSYLGMNQLPEGAISRSMKGMEEVLVNLKNLSETDAGSEEE